MAREVHRWPSPAWMMAERRPGSVSWVAVTRMLANPLASSRVRYSAAVRVPVVQPICCSASALYRLEAFVSDDVADPEPAARTQHPERLGQHAGLVGGQVDHAVGRQQFITSFTGRGIHPVATPAEEHGQRGPAIQPDSAPTRPGWAAELRRASQPHSGPHPHLRAAMQQHIRPKPPDGGRRQRPH